jgi:hypothetical protein
MSLRLGDTAPDFSADTTAGPIDFHHWAGESWVVLEDVIIVPAVRDEEARGKFRKGWKALKPYLRLTPQPDR